MQKYVISVVGHYAIVFTLPIASDIIEDLLLELALFTVPLGEANMPLPKNLALGGS